MATNIRWRKRFLRNGTEFDDSGTNDIKMYLSTVAGAIGAEVGSLTYEGDGGWWYIDIDIDTYNSNYYALRYNVGAGFVTMDAAKNSGCAPLFIDLENHMPLRGGTMTGNIAMGIQSLTNVRSLTFNDTAGTIGKGAGTVANGNLIDKTADETVSGAWTFSGDCTLSGVITVTGITSFTEDKCLINSVISTPYLYITKTFGITDSETDINQVIFNCDAKMTVLAIESIHSVPSTPAITLQVERLSGTEAVEGGDDMLDPAFNLQGAANTIQSEKEPTNASLVIGDRIAVYVSGNPTDLEGLHLTIKLSYVGA